MAGKVQPSGRANNDIFVIIYQLRSIFARLDDHWVIVYDPLPALRMDQIPAPDLPLIPYSQASPAQVAQAMFTAKEALGPSYANLAWLQLEEAFIYFQPLLLSDHKQVSVTAEGLTAIAQYLDTQYPIQVPLSPRPPIAATPLPALEHAPASLLLQTKLREKKTYSLRPSVLRGLERVSFWRRVTKSALVNLALEQLLATYPEAQIPIP